MAHGPTWVGKWRGNRKMEWVCSKHHVTGERTLSSTVTTVPAEVHTSRLPSNELSPPPRVTWTCGAARQSWVGHANTHQVPVTERHGRYKDSGTCAIISGRQMTADISVSKRLRLLTAQEKCCTKDQRQSCSIQELFATC
jgi:hypothetical protein